MKKLFVILFLLLSACSQQEQVPPEIEELPVNETTPTRKENVIVTDEVVEKVKQHVIDSHVYDEYMQSAFVDFVEVYNAPYGLEDEEFISIRVHHQDGPTITIQIGNNHVNDGTYKIVYQGYNIDSYFIYQRFSNTNKANIRFMRVVDTGETMYSMEAFKQTYAMRYDKETNKLINNVTGNEFEFLEDLHYKLIKIYNMHDALYEKRLKNDELLAANIMRIINDEEPIMNYDLTPIGIGEYMQSIREKP